MRVLILNAPYGNGHKYCSKAITNGFCSKNIDVVELDFYEKFAPEKLINISKHIHKKTFSWWGRPLYKIGYVTSDKFFLPEISTKSAIGKKSLEKFLLEQNFNKVIITFPIAAIFPLSKQLKQIDFYEVVTDFSLHKKWQNPNLKAIFVGHEFLVKNHPKLKNLVVSGIPIIKKKINYDNVLKYYYEDKTISIILGANGVINSNLEFIEKLSKKYGLNVVCGNNVELYKKLTKKYKNINNIKIWGFVKDIENLYTASDLVITKSGGMTCSELIHYNCKAIFFKPQYGQERDNALFFEKYNLGKIIDNNSISRQVQFVLNLNANFKDVKIKNSIDIIMEMVLKNEN